MRKKTIRKLTPQARELAKIHNELTSITRRLKNMIGKLVEVEATGGLIGNGHKEWFEGDDSVADKAPSPYLEYFNTGGK